MDISTTIRPLHPRNLFRISRAVRREVRNVFLRIEHEGVTAFGEAAPNEFYGENAGDVQKKLKDAAGWLASQQIRSVDEIEKIWTELWPALQPSRAAQCAVDIALWDLLGKRRGISVTGLAFGQSPRPIDTFCTIGISSAEELAAKLNEVTGFPLIKIKSDQSTDLAPVRTIRAATHAPIAIDANCAWSDIDIPNLSHGLKSSGIVFIEQPLPPERHQEMPSILQQSALPIMADESCVTRDDVDRMPGHFSGFNIKLVKCGGLTPALAMLRRGRQLGLKVMVGCMLESSLLIAAGAVVAQQADYADLDGAWLLADDPVRGWEFSKGTLQPPDRPGLGIVPDEALFTD